MSFDYALRHMIRADAEEGRVIEGAWRAFATVCGYDLKPTEQRDDAQIAFFAGAYEMLLSLCGGVFDDGDTVSPGDERRMLLVQNELNTFFEQHSRKLGFITAQKGRPDA